MSDTPIGTIALDDTRVLGETLPPPSMDAYRRLEQIWLNGEPVTVVTGLKKYESMGLEELTVPREAKNAGGLVFTVKFKEIRLAKNKRVRMAVPNAGGEANKGLSLDNLVNANQVLWRKGSPPGSSPSTVPPGKIIGQETVTYKQTPGHTKVLHESGKELTTQEYRDFTADLNRDVALSTNRGLARAEQDLNNGIAVTDRANNMLDYKTAHPGENPDPAQFGLKKDPTSGHYTAI